MSEPYMKFELHNSWIRFTCDICGGSTEKVAVFVFLGDDLQAHYTEDVCFQCLDAGPKGAAERARASVERLKKLVDIRTDLAKWLEEFPEAKWMSGQDKFDFGEREWMKLEESEAES